MSDDGRKRSRRLRDFREFRLTSLAVDHPTAVLVMTVILIIGGLASYLRIPKEAAPEVRIPMVAVNTVYTGVSPRDVETLITRPLEEELNKIPDIAELRSVSAEGYSSLTAEFVAGMDMTEALQSVREKVDIAKPELPPAAEEPMILEFDVSEFPILQVNVSGDYDLVRLKQVAEDLQDRFEQIPSVLEVTLSGGIEREVQVDVDLPRLKHYGLSFQDVVDAISAENVTTPGGTIDVGGVKYLVRVPGEFEETAVIDEIVVASPGDRPIYVRDLATVEFGFEERESFARLDGRPVVTLGIKKRSGENIIETVEAVKQAIEEERADFPAGTVVKLTADQSEDIRKMVSSLENNIISGLILVVAVLLFFLGALTASIVGMAIPLSMLISFSVLSLLGFTMNMVVLFSLILALGMLVDNAVVVVENVYRFREEGHDARAAAKLATAEVATPVIAATATTLAAFFPLAFWPGMVGEFMGYLPKTLIITLGSSLFVALVINPVLCSLWLRPDGEPRPALAPGVRWALIGGAAAAMAAALVFQPLAALTLSVTGVAIWFLHRRVFSPLAHRFQGEGMRRLLAVYERLLRGALARRGLVMGTAVALLVAAVGAFSAFNAGIEFFPEDIPPATAYVQVEAPTGTRADETDRAVRRLEQQLGGFSSREDFSSVVSTVGSAETGFGMGGPTGTHLATVAVTFVDFQDRRQDVFRTMEEMRSALGRDVAGVELTVERPPAGPPTGKPVTVEISGLDADRLAELGERAVALLSNHPVARKLDGLESDLADARPELTVRVNRERASVFGLNTREVGQTVRGAIQGTVASEFRDGEDEHDIRVRLARPYREDLSSLADLTVVTDDGRQVPLPSVAEWSTGSGYAGINRKDLERMVTVSADVRAGYNANAVLEEVQGVLAELEADLPQEYRLAYAGQQEEQLAAQEFLSGAFLVALLLIAFILVAQFDSLTKPLIILSSVILSTIGVLVGLLVFRMPFGVIMTGVGVISLAGIVVNNAIVMVDYIDVLRVRDGLGRLESLVQGGLTRFRPVVLTAITTIFGLVPLAIGLNFDFVGFFAALSPDLYWGGEQAAWWAPMAIAVIAGLAFATFLTLFLVPVMYSFADTLSDFGVRYFSRREAPEEGPTPSEERADSAEDSEKTQEDRETAPAAREMVRT